MTDPLSFTKMVPGFDFLQGLVKNAGAALPNVGHWIAPTLDPEELEKRIEELRTVQFWLEQNARMLGATIQALEVQRMTLSTLKTMNVSLGDLTESLKIRTPDTAAAPPAPAPRPRAAAPAPEPEPQAEAEAPAAAPAVPPGVIDPMQWWGALTKQFTDLAASAMNETATDAAKNLAGAMVKQSFDAAGETLKKAAAMPGTMVKTAASVAQKAASVAGTVAGAATAPAKAVRQSAAAPRAKPTAAKKAAAPRQAATKRSPR
ncbi:PhaM family polyhydroxyalkanoate granule multifunctional regulatory protein [Ideonella sp. DXS22W]|uniref:PhaM family polyhydroxyalkanoate granule multifunctional regulatory protein n=1 Tax=Pseudaquabacterium inlustre TaxID=2984192 RepID=A0ABU9CMZ4_9BURK